MTDTPTVDSATAKVNAYPCPRVSLVVTPGADNASVTIWRNYPAVLGVAPVAVRGAYQAAVAGPLHIDDYEVPFGLEVTYTATGYDAEGAASATSAASTAVLVDDTACPWVQDPLDPNTATRWQIAEWPELERERDASILYPLLESAAVAISSQLREPTCEMVARTTTAEGAASLLALVRSAPALLIRCPSTWGVGWTSRYWFASEVTETRRYPYRATVAERLWTLALTSVTAPTADTVVPVWTWADVPEYYATWADVVTAKATWADLYTDVPPAT